MFISRIQSQIQRVYINVYLGYRARYRGYINVYIQDTELDSEGIYKCISRIQSQIQRVYINIYIQDTELDTEGIYKCLYERAPPPPNQSTQTQPLSNTDFIYQVIIKKSFQDGGQGRIRDFVQGGCINLFLSGRTQHPLPPYGKPLFLFLLFLL